MSAIQIFGSLSLKGEVKVQGSKNAVLPIMAGALLCEGVTVIHNVPRIQDVFCMVHILEELGCKVVLDKNTLIIDASSVTSVEISEKYVDKMRSSIMVLGALIGRMKEAVTYFPGGCSIGERKIDLHLLALKKFGVTIRVEDRCIAAESGQLNAALIDFPKPSVGATENAILAGVLADGTTVLTGYALEPEIVELCSFLNSMGAKISGIGSQYLKICGVKKLHGCEYVIGGDRIVAGTYLAAAIAGQGEITINGIKPVFLDAVLKQYSLMGADVGRSDDSIHVRMVQRPQSCALIRTAPYPGFPTDMQSQTMAVLAVAAGDSMIEENIFEGRMETAKELNRMGADIKILDCRAHIRGVSHLTGCDVAARDLRGGAALVIAGLCASGRTTIYDCEHILRGYEDICRDIRMLGGNIYYKSSAVQGT